ncbi:MAG: cupin domain-containing protein [Lentisphaerae bacterium]|nr:cupin domain-containing protein [Lentisphaerota bacterium]MBR2872251.1 N-acetylneuraminate synthase family protein [Lentisphaeria bacterium]
MAIGNKSIFDRLVIFEMANNHSGDVEHGKALIRKYAEVAKKFPEFRCVIKFQYRDIPTFIHPDFKERFDFKYVKRFSETALPEEAFIEMKKCADECGILTACTPFDEVSVDRVIKHGFDFLKIASCSFTDWPLLEKAASAGKPVIISTAGARQEDINNVVSFFEHRQIDFALMHCVGSYPTPDTELELNQLDYYQHLFPGLPVGFSTHEDPENYTAVMLAVAKGALILERHVGLPTEKYSLNAYSSTPEQTEKWLAAAQKAYAMCGVKEERRSISEKEASDLQGLQRGVFVKAPVKKGERIKSENLFYAIPCLPGQMRANDLSKYLELTAQEDLPANAPVMFDNTQIINRRSAVLSIIRELGALLASSGVPLMNRMNLELSHHYGIDKFKHSGCAIITCINREYCKKIIALLPGQNNPTHTHKQKEETFHVLYGDMTLELNGVKKTFHPGDLIVVERGVAHSFGSDTGAVMEEISTTHFPNDSFYDDPAIQSAEQRKTYMTFYADWLKDGGKTIR